MFTFKRDENHLDTGKPRRDRSTDGGSFIVDGKGTVLGFDLGMEVLTGWPAAEVVGRHKDFVRSAGADELGMSGEGRAPLYEGAIVVEGSWRRVELRLGCHDGRSVDVEAVATRLPGSKDRYLVSVLRVLARSSRPIREDSLGEADPLTGLAASARFNLRLQEIFQRADASACPVSLILVDVDRLRRVNDRLGRAAGDEVLRKLAGIIRATVRDDDMVARLAEDTFAILLVGPGRGEARHLASRLRSTVERFRFFGAQEGEAPTRVTLSLGSASSPADADNAADLVERAREALEEARALGRNRVWCYMRRPRVPLRTPVYFDGVEPQLVGYTSDLSPSGLFVQTPTPIDIGMRCALSFPLPSCEGNIHVIGRIVRTVPVQEALAPSQPRVPGMGVEFERFGSEDRRAIEAFLYAHEHLTRRPENGMVSL